MLKTAQNSKIITFDPEHKLFSTKEKLSFGAKMTPYQKEVTYTDSKNDSVTKTFTERTYLREKTISHVKKLQTLEHIYSLEALEEKINFLKNNG